VTDTAAFVEGARDAILGAAGETLSGLRAPHYESAGAEERSRRLAALFDRLVDGLRGRNLEPVVTYAEQVARERFEAGYGLAEVQGAFNALEEATWARAIAELDPAELAETLGMVSTVLGAGKDALARTYVSLAADTHAPSLDLRALFAGTD
jgi:hypothetical protein